MWAKTIETKIKNQKVQVQVWLDDSDGEYEVVKIQSMLNEYYLIDTVKFNNRDSAYDFIKDYTVTMANSFLNRLAYTEGAIN